MMTLSAECQAMFDAKYAEAAAEADLLDMDWIDRPVDEVVSVPAALFVDWTCSEPAMPFLRACLPGLAVAPAPG